MLGTTLIVASANALNCWIERDVDRLMTRTADRPLAARRLDPRLGLGFGLALGAIATPILTFLVNPLTGVLGSAALVLYTAVYTPLKQHSPVALLVGAVPGAVPPLMGWTAATGSLAWPAAALFGVLFLWQLPHFIAIASFRRDEYTRAGIRVVTAVRGDRAARLHAVAWAAMLLPVSLSLSWLGTAGWIYFAVALAAGVAYLVAAVRGLSFRDPLWSRKLFATSLVYLPVVLAALMLDAR
jgi:protoheme IX farnesyltransferase